jgi:biopolymer transport protein ExbD
MGRFKDSGSEDGGEVNVDLTPMIDCVFILLIFFIVTTTFVEESGVEVDKPQAASAVSLEKSSILIAITAKGEVVYGGRDIGVRGVRGTVSRMLQREPDMPVIVQADSAAQTGLLVRVVDESKLAGAKRVNIATRAGKG